MKTGDKSKIIKGIVLIFLFISFIIFFNSVFSLSSLASLNFASFLYMLGKLAGLIGFLFLSILIFSGDTARFFDRFFGMDKIIKFQRKFSVITLLFILLHPIFFILSSGSYLNYLIPNFAVIPLALGTISLYILVVVMISSKLYKRISYNTWQYIHILTYLLFFFVLYHAVNLGSESRLLSIKLVYGILVTLVSMGAIYRTVYKIKQKSSEKFYVNEITKETEDTFTLILKPEKRFLFCAGQFCFLRLNKDRLYARHPFTISSSPNEDELHFTVKLEGRFTKALSELKKGEEVIVDGPFGIFTIEDEKRDLVFIAGGIGITPFMSMIKDKIGKKEQQNVLLLYGSRTKKNIIFEKKLDKIKNKWFKKIYVTCEDKSGSSKCEVGYIDKRIIKKYVRNVDNSIFYICGPEPLKDSVKIILKELGVKKKNILIEDFFW